MALTSQQVKFNQGTKAQASLNLSDEIGFLADSASLQTASDFGYLYLGSKLVATKYLSQMDPVGPGTTMVAPTADNPRVILSVLSNSNSVVSTSRLVKYSQMVAQSGGSYTYDPSAQSADDDILTARAANALVGRMMSTNDKYHSSGAWGTNPNTSTTTNWYTYTATNVNSAPDLQFALPVVDSTGGFAPTDDTHLITPKAIADYFSSLAGGMRYAGSLTSSTLPTGTGTLAPYKTGDVFIAASAFTVGTSPNQRSVDSGDMIVLNGNYTTGNLAYSGGVWNFDLFERNLDNAVTGSGTAGALTKWNTSSSVSSIALPSANSGYILQVVRTGSGTTQSPYAYAYSWVNPSMVTAISGIDSSSNQLYDQLSVTTYGYGSTATTSLVSFRAKSIYQNVIGDGTTDAWRPVVVSSESGTTNASYSELGKAKFLSYNLKTGAIKTTGDVLINSSVSVSDTVFWHTLGS